MQPLEHHLRNNPQIRLDKSDDHTLSTSQRAHARIVAALLADWDALDGAQQSHLSRALAESAAETVAEEQDGLRFLGLTK